VTWRQVAAYIEARKAEALAALMAAWKEQHP
jgi:tRNA isopentenyl-2-thiomethyl-A-37 hydroxylase MiaE